MDHLFGAHALVSRRFRGNIGSNLGSNSRSRQNSCDNIPDQVCVSKKKMLKRAASFCGRHLLSSAGSSASNSELINIVDAQLMQIKEKLAAFREQDTQFRERMNSLSDSVSELSSSRSSLSSFTPSDCSDLGSLDEAQRTELPEEENSLEEQTVPFFKGSRDLFNYIRRATSDPSSLYSHKELPEEEAMETERPHSTSTDQAVIVYPQYNNPDEISTLF